MFVPFESLPSSSRVWVFQSNRPFRNDEAGFVEEALRAFTDQWAVHGSPFDTTYSIRYNQFIILAADESRQSASGCSIDSSVRVLKEIEARLGVDLFNREQVAFLVNDQVVLWPMKDLKEKFATGILTANSLTFNNLVATKGELDSRWIIPAGETWVKRYIPNAVADAK